MKKLFLLLLLTGFLAQLNAQVVTIEPAEATVDDTVTVYFDATKGDQGLMDFDGDVYAHTGVITTESNNSSDWKHVVADWGTADENVLMTQESENLYSLSFHIRSFYGIQEDETVLQLAFVFRNADGSESARNEDGSDILVPLSVPADEYLNHEWDENRLTIFGSENKYVIEPWQSGIFNLSVYQDEIVTDSSYAVIAEPQMSEVSFQETDDMLILLSGENRVEIEKTPLQFNWIQGERVLFQQKTALLNGSASGGLIDFQVSDEESFYGTGFRALPVDRRGYQLEFYNQAHYGYSNNTPNLNISIPLLISNRNYGVFFDNHYPASMDIATSGNTLRYSNESGVMDYFFLFGNSQAGILERYTGLTGRQELPPIWSLGYIQSRYGYETQQEAEDVVEQMQDSGFPLDVLVLDLYWFGSPAEMGNLSWDYSRFPQPEEMMENFDEEGIKTILITEPYFTTQSNHFDELADLGFLATQPSGDPFVLHGFWAGDAGLLDMTNPGARNWMWEFYRQRNAEGVAGWWTDLAEPESHPDEMQHQEGSAREVHNIFNLKWQQMLHEKHAEEYPGKRLFNLSRSGWAGMQRYSAFPWSGDIQRSFAGLQAQIPAMLGMSMSGVGYMHSDIGGFTGGGQNEELYTRWMQLGAFAPVMRAHGHDVPPEPIYYNTQTQDRVREMIKLRYRFLPYNYQLAYENTTYGLPLARPLNFHEPRNNMLTNINDAFFWGNDVLVSPVVEEGQNSKEVFFPSGEWYGFDTAETFPGNTTQTVDAPIDELPLFVRAGSFLMLLNEEIMTTEQYESKQLQVQYYLPESGNSSSRRYYVDDGITRGNLAQEQYEILLLTAHPSENMLEMLLDKEGNYVSERDMEFVVFGLQSKPSSVAVNEYAWEVTENETFYQEGKELAWWSDADKTLKLGFSWGDSLTSITVDRQEVGLAESLKKDKNLVLHQPSPNPFDSDTRITMDLKKPGKVHFALRDIRGNLIGSQARRFSKGRHQFMLSEIAASGLTPGIYFITAENQTGKAILKLVKVQ